MSAATLRSWIRSSTSAALAVLVVSMPASAAGPAPAKPHASSPPSKSRLPQSAALGTSAGTAPFAWVDDATLLPAGIGAVTVSAASWHGTDASEVEVPIVGAALGIAPRLQISARVPYVVDDAAAGVV